MNMGGQRGTFNPHGPIEQDRRLASVLQRDETVTSAGAGALLLPMRRPERGKVYITSLRLAVVPDDPRVTKVWSEAWQRIELVRVKKGFVGATAYVTVDAGELGVDSTKAMVADIERAWVHMRSNSPTVERRPPNFLPSVEVRCGGCGQQIRPGVARCRMCLREISWPQPLDLLSQAVEDPEVLLPETFSDGQSTQRDAVFSGLATLTAAAKCSGEYPFVGQVANLLDHIRGRIAAPPEAFGSLPLMQGAGDPASNAKFWDLCCQVPGRLAK